MRRRMEELRSAAPRLSIIVLRHVAVVATCKSQALPSVVRYFFIIQDAVKYCTGCIDKVPCRHCDLLEFVIVIIIL